MKTYKQIISEVGQLGYEYAAGINIQHHACRGKRLRYETEGFDG